MNTPIQAVIFDKDGTLFDTEKVFMRAWKLAAAELNVPDIEPTVRDCTGKTIPDIAIYWAAKYPTIPFEDYLPRRQHHFHAIIDAEGVPVKDGAMAILAYLKGRGVKIALATSAGHAEAVQHLTQSGLMPYFDAIVTSDMVEHGKPAPDAYLLAASKLGVEPAFCIGVEDSLNGVKSIHAAGMRAVMIPDMIPPTEEIRGLLWRECQSLDALREELERL